MKQLIKKLLREGLLGEERISLSDMDKYILIYLKEDNIFLIINRETKEPMGYISFALTNGDVYGIYGVYSKKGFGPILYELAMTQVYPKGITMSDDSTTSDDAINVWEKFYQRGDVIKKPIIRSGSTEKEELLKMFKSDGDIDDDYYNKILNLHHTQFIYNIGKDKLEALIEVGDKFKNANKDLNYMNMVYSLEK